jgi:5-oxoprolinase (ATP-hydrolysing)
MPLLVAVDTGGTFTDVVATDGHRLVSAKVPSTPHDPSQAVAHGIAEALARLGVGGPPDRLIHGTTVATNALLEGEGARVRFVTNEGFEDLLAIGRQHREVLQSLEVPHRFVAVRREDCVGVPGRIDVDGSERTPLDLRALERLLASLPADDDAAWAVCGLHAWTNSAHEEAILEVLSQAVPTAHVSTSARVLPVFREVERAQTTVANARIAPKMARYLERLRPLARKVEVMGSSGGRLQLSEARDRPVLTALSGPAGGVVAAARIAEKAACGVLSFDMGGTSTDVAHVPVVDGRARLPVSHAGRVGPWAIHTPMLAIHTVGAGGGSLVWMDEGGALRVGPQSAGADPGPACYGRGTEPTITDANLLLGHIRADARLGGSLPLHPDRARAAFGPLAATLGCSEEEVARGALRIVDATMAGALRRVTSERGVDPRELLLCAFGGAGPQHACALADELGVRRVVVPSRAGVLSAWGIARSEGVAERARTVLDHATYADVLRTAEGLADEAVAALGDGANAATVEVQIDARHTGQGYELSIPLAASEVEAVAAFGAAHEARFGYQLDAPVEWVTLRVRAHDGAPPTLPTPAVEPQERVGPFVEMTDEYALHVPAGWKGRRDVDGDWWLEPVTGCVEGGADEGAEALGAVEVELFRRRFEAVAEEMGELLTRAAFSPNIRERRDHSCAVLDEAGRMVAQAAHIPVHLGAAPLCVQAVIAAGPPAPGETWIVNDPFSGGTHLPDITLVTAVPIGEGRCWYVSTRAHHADVGGISPGSLPPSTRIEEEGWRTPPVPLTDDVVASLLAASRTPEERVGDLRAQRAANARGAERIAELVERFGGATLCARRDGLLAWSSRSMRRVVETIPVGRVEVQDVLDDADGGGVPITIRLTAERKETERGPELWFDFSASDDAVEGPMNAVRAIVESAVFHALLCVADGAVAPNGGVLEGVKIVTRSGSVVDARAPSAVAAGNVETSQRLVDVLLAALAELGAEGVSAASCGSMNNVTIGGTGAGGAPWVYYETIGGGAGAGPRGPGASAVHVHMTNTWNTPVEALEAAFPMRVERYAVRWGSGGAGRHAGGDGIVRELSFRAPATVRWIGERRLRGAPGAVGGQDGAPGREVWARSGEERALPGKGLLEVQTGDRFRVETPGGGGWGPED